MKKSYLVFCALCWVSTFSYSQIVNYSRQTFPAPESNVVQLVANVSGYHHVLGFNTKKFPVIYIFDAQLQLLSTKEINFTLKEGQDIKIIPFAGYYFLYIHAPSTHTHELWRIDGTGNFTYLTQKFEHFIQKEFGKSYATLHLINQDEHLFLVAHRHYGGINKIGSTVIQFDNELDSVNARKVYYAYNRGDKIIQVKLVKNNLLVLKTSSTNDEGNMLDLHKIDLNTGQSIQNIFKSASHVYITPGFTYNDYDSSILVYALIREPLSISSAVNAVFISRLDHLLHEEVPMTLLKKQFRNNAGTNFLFVNGQYPYWLTMNGFSNSRMVRANSFTNRSYNSSSTMDQPAFDNRMRTGTNLVESPLDPVGSMDNNRSGLSSLNSASARYTPDNRFSQDIGEGGYSNYGVWRPDNTQPHGIRFSILNEKFRIINDSMIDNNKLPAGVQPSPYGQFMMNNKSYLILIRNLTSSGKGLLMMSTGDAGQLISSEIRVHLRYDYKLSQLQSVGNKYFILPYINKREMGLVKITMEN